MGERTPTLAYRIVTWVAPLGHNCRQTCSIPAEWKQMYQVAAWTPLSIYSNNKAIDKSRFINR